MLDNVIDPDTATMIYMMFETCTAITSNVSTTEYLSLISVFRISRSLRFEAISVGMFRHMAAVELH